MNCNFQTIKDNVHQCINCQIIIKMKRDPSRIIRSCTGTTSTTEKILGAVNTAKDFIASGFELTKTEEKNNRLEICKTCDQYDNGVCKLCTCNMNLKTRINSAHCPIGKW